MRISTTKIAILMAGYDQNMAISD